MEKTFNPNAIEQALYQHWEAQGYFKPHGDTSQDAYCIMLPPPNVTGSLHMGHAFQQTIMDALTRYQRMLGKNTLWQAGRARNAKSGPAIGVPLFKIPTEACARRKPRDVSALTRLEALLDLVDDVDAALAAHELVVAMARTQRLQRITDLHRLNSIGPPV